MMQHKLKISAQQQPTIMEKLLQVSRYRGFTINGIVMFPQTDTDMLDIELSVCTSKPIEQLTLQLNKLYDVQNITVNSTEELQYQA